MARAGVLVLAVLATIGLAACADAPGADGRYASRTGNRGEANVGLPPTPYVPR
ncbi:MAG: hypothetical protein KIT25_17115 [Enhydrobacter sp.]|nr:MAG: hypothetical protein KIT25_17115 [Enhydrobacter sp.]